jgi:hypothetical protein
MKYAISINYGPYLCDLQLVPDVSMFDSYDDAVDYAKELFPKVSDCYDELCVMEINEADGTAELLWDSTTWQEEIEEG